MTCQEIRKHIANSSQNEESKFWSDSRVTAHVASCARCSQFVRECQNLGKSLQLVRESDGPVPESLDAAVLAGYRRFIAERTAEPPQYIRKTHLSLGLRWAAAAAVVLIATAITLYSTRKPTKTTAVPAAVEPSTASAARMPQTRGAQPQIRPPRRSVSPMRKHSVPYDAHLAAATVAPLPDDFRGLIYCDELSCSGAMDMIRVQLPSSMIARPTSAFRATSSPVFADVLIGADGIARGIRIEKREF